MLDLKITGGDIVDGTGRPRFRGDVGVKDGRVVTIGDLSAETARESVDASGRIVCPGFIDAHTHYDVQVFWDPKLTPSCFHGVTTVVGGLCGFSIAPMTPEAETYCKPMLARVEGMPLETLEAATPWDWRSFGDYLGRLDGRIGINAGFFAGHSVIRRVVMGQRAVGEKATPEEVRQMRDLLDQSLAEGALGFSTTRAATHNDADGNPVPSRWADVSEVLELAGVVSRHDGAGLELLPEMKFEPDTIDLLAKVSAAGARPVNWNMILVTGQPEAEQPFNHQLSASDYAKDHDGEVIGLTNAGPVVAYLNLRTGFIFDGLPGLWREVFKSPVADRIARFKDPELRARLAADAGEAPGLMHTVANFADFTVVETISAENKRYEARKIGEIAAEEGKAAIDVLFDIAIADDLDTLFTMDSGGDDLTTYRLRARLWEDDRILIGGSDAGAHLDILDSFSYTTTLLQKGVREYKVIGLEQAIQKITQRPATYFGLIDRGVIAVGHHADIVVFDEANIRRGPIYQKRDLPGEGGFRVYGEAEGIDHIFVNGVEIVRKGEHTGKLPGTVLRSGKDTRTTAIGAMRAHALAAERNVGFGARPKGGRPPQRI